MRCKSTSPKFPTPPPPTVLLAGGFKIFSDAWSKKSGGRVGDDDNWGTRYLNACCGRMDVPIPKALPSGDYLLRAEALALHTAGQSGGAQFYISCYQITVSGGGSANYATVKLPGAYRASDPGIQINMHAVVSDDVAPGPAVVAGGVTKQAGSGCTGCESTCKVGSSPSAVAPGGKPASGGSDGNAPEVGEPNSEGSPSAPGSEILLLLKAWMKFMLTMVNPTGRIHVQGCLTSLLLAVCPNLVGSY